MTYRIALLLFPLLAAGAEAPLFTELDLDTSRTLRGHALAGDGGYSIVADLTTRIGARPAGSEADARSVAWAVELFEQIGFDRVWTQPVTFPCWRRGAERVEVVSPYPQPLVAIGLGYSPPTPEGGIRAEVRAFADLAALEAADPEAVAGRIAFISNRMQRMRSGAGYSQAVPARSRGPAVAAEKGAAALLIRSIGTSSDRFAHTGMIRTSDEAPLVPAAALSNPDADQLERLFALGGPVEIHLEIENDGAHETCASRNVIGEITGASAPEKIVAIGAHLDSWDVGTGAIDDAAGVGIVTEAARLILRLDRRPARSIHVILFAAEEIGLHGANAWRDANLENLEYYQLGAESDFGAGLVYEIQARVADEAWPVIEAIQRELEPLGIALGGREAFGGADFSPMRKEGLAVVDLRQDGTEYFDYHHTDNDTLDKIIPENLVQNAAAFAVLAWLAAQSPLDFGSGPGLKLQAGD